MQSTLVTPSVERKPSYAAVVAKGARSMDEGKWHMSRLPTSDHSDNRKGPGDESMTGSQPGRQQPNLTQSPSTPSRGKTCQANTMYYVRSPESNRTFIPSRCHNDVGEQQVNRKLYTIFI